jgi:hypothetical protein
MAVISYIIPYYRAPKMLEQHVAQWVNYTQEIRECIRIVVIDDGSPEPAEPIVREARLTIPGVHVELYRIKEDIPWNRNGARNLGAHVATTPWLLHTDIDHVLPPGEAEKLLEQKLTPNHWYRFRRFRVGTADETRKKDTLPPDATFGEIKPHGDSYLCTRELYWKVGGYDEDYSGALGGGTPFLEQLNFQSSCVILPVSLHVYTRSVVSDASVSTLSRDASTYIRIRDRKRQTGQTKATQPLRFEWSRVL